MPWEPVLKLFLLKKSIYRFRKQYTRPIEKQHKCTMQAQKCYPNFTLVCVWVRMKNEKLFYYSVYFYYYS